MTRLSKPDIHLALIHYPVLGRHGQRIASAVTNLDLHDIARTAKTYDVAAVYIVTPLIDQLEMVDKIIEYWVSGAGSIRNPQRKAAFSILRRCETIDHVLSDIEQNDRGKAKLVATSARHRAETIDFGCLREMTTRESICLLLGTAWGLAEELIARADYLLEPIKGVAGYNHLPVRSAAAITLDRLRGAMPASCVNEASNAD